VNGPTLLVLGRRVRPIERIPVAAALLGVCSRATAYRLCKAESWETVGSASSRWCLMIPLLTRYGIPFEVEPADGGEGA